MSPSGGKTRLTTFDIINSHGTNLKMSLAQSSLQSTNSPMPYSGYMTSISMTSMTSQSSTDGSLNSFNEAILQKNKLDSPIIRELCPCRSDAASPCPTQCLPLSVNGSRELQISTQCQTSTERWTKVTENGVLNVWSYKWKFDELSVTSPESLMLRTLKTLTLQLM